MSNPLTLRAGWIIDGSGRKAKKDMIIEIEAEAIQSIEELTATVAVARKLKLKTMVHANGVLPADIAISAGCDSIEHGFFMGDDNLRRLADHQAVWVPTAVTMSAYQKLMQARGEDTDVVRRNLDLQLAQMELARRLGVRVALGTDAGSAGVHHGAAVIAEMKLFLKTGYRIEEVIRCVCANGARVLDLQASGMLQSGQPATFVVVPGPPRDLPESLNRVAAVFINGTAVYQP